MSIGYIILSGRISKAICMGLSPFAPVSLVFYLDTPAGLKIPWPELPGSSIITSKIRAKSPLFQRLI